MKKLLVIGDLHLREDSPYFQVGSRFLEYLLGEEDLNNEDTTLLFLGDIYHRALPGGPVEFIFTDFLHKRKAKEVIILQGNHDFSRKDGSALEPLKCIKGVRIIDHPMEENLYGLDILYLPYLYPHTVVTGSMGKYYSESENFLKKDFDYIFGHFGDETSGKWTQEADTSWINGKKIFGHIHNRVSTNYLGTPYPTRRDEKGRVGILELIDTTTKKSETIKLPKFFDYYQVEYNKGVIIPEAEISMIDIIKAPSTDLAIQEFKEKYSAENIYLGKIEKEILSQLREEGKDVEIKTSLPEYIDSFAEANQISEKVTSLMQEVATTTIGA